MLIKNAEALERFAKVDTLVVDKTGTLTEGKPKVIALVPAAGVEEDDLLRLAASIERASEHPLAAAIVAAAEARGLKQKAAGSMRFPARACSAGWRAARSRSAISGCWRRWGRPGRAVWSVPSGYAPRARPSCSW